MNNVDFVIERTRDAILVTPMTHLAYEWWLNNYQEAVRWGRSLMLKATPQSARIADELKAAGFSIAVQI
jgi:hypothetical protein